MRPHRFLVLLRLFALVALVASGALFVDYTQPEPTFCGAGSGCAEVRASGFGYVPLGDTYLPLPMFGIIGFSALLVLSLVGRPERRKNRLLVLALPGALVALFLLYLQAAAVGAFCSLCVVVDVTAIAAGVSAIGYRRSLARRPEDEDGQAAVPDLRAWAWLALGAVALVSPFVWQRVKPTTPVPASVRALYVPGKINVIEFADYECPFCRELHPRLKMVLGPYQDRVHFIRLNFPLESHPFAQGAARAEVCAAAQNKGPQMADALFAAEDLSPEHNRRLAVELGLDMTRFDQCLNDPATDKKISEQKSVLEKGGFQGLPTTFVQDRQLIGAVPDEMFRDALERSARGEQRSGIGGVRYVMLVLAVALGIASLGRPKKVEAPPPRTRRAPRRRPTE